MCSHFYCTHFVIANCTHFYCNVYAFFITTGTHFYYNVYTFFITICTNFSLQSVRIFYYNVYAFFITICTNFVLQWIRIFYYNLYAFLSTCLNPSSTVTFSCTSCDFFSGHVVAGLPNKKLNIKPNNAKKRPEKDQTDCLKASKSQTLRYCYTFVTKKHLNYKKMIRNFLRNSDSVLLRFVLELIMLRWLFMVCKIVHFGYNGSGVEAGSASAPPKVLICRKIGQKISGTRAQKFRHLYKRVWLKKMNLTKNKHESD